MKKHLTAVFTGASLLIALTTSEASRAQAAAVPGEASGDNGDTLETIVVTAQRREEQLQNVPIAVKAFSQQDIADLGIASTSDFVAQVPNMSFDQSFTYGNSFVVLRGVTQINNADSPVAVVVDGVPQNNQKQFNMNLFDIERIEVLKGPQGALYGRNAIGGAVNIVTRQPTNQFEGYVDARAANADTQEYVAAISGPIVADRLLFRIAGQYKDSDGQIDNVYLHQEADKIHHDDSVSGTLLYNVSDTVALDLRGSYRDIDAGAVMDAIVDSGDANDIEDPRSDLLGRTFGTTADFSLKASVDWDFATLTAISAYTNLREDYRGDLDFSNPVDDPTGFSGLGFQAGQGQNLGVKMWSQEIRLTSPSAQRLRWTGGMYYLDTRRDLETRAFIDTDGNLDQFSDPSKQILDNNEHNDNDAWSVFGQIDYDLSQALTFSAAQRYDRDERKQHNVNDGSSRSQTFDRWEPKFTLTYHLDPDKLAYVTYSTGFRSGGFNSPGLPAFKSETLKNTEAGVKTAWFGNRLRANIAVFESHSDDFQYFFVDTSTASQVISNIDRVRARGVDFDAEAKIVRGLEVNAGLGLTDSEIRRNGQQSDTVGNHTPKNTPVTFNAGAQYSVPLSATMTGFVRGDYLHSGKKYWQIDNVNVQNPIDLFNLRIGVRDPRWEAYLWGHNLSNEKYYADYNPKEYSGSAFDIGSLAAQRTYGVEAKLRF